VTQASEQCVRVDRWLWAARAFRSRTLAADACDGGKIAVNGARAKPHKLLRPGDLVAVSTPSGERRLKVVGIAERRGPASQARTLYEDLTPPRPPAEKSFFRRERGSGRPTKRERRQLDRWSFPGTLDPSDA
jgi:ribosome-associated heat shock protein Hsp15